MPGPETGLVVGIKHIITYVAVPIIALLAWVARRLHTRVDKLEEKVGDMDKAQAVHEAQLSDIKQDIHNIDKKLDKIIDAIHK